MIHSIDDILVVIRLRRPTESEVALLYQTLDNLQDYTVTHFSEEEAFMAQIDYPHIEIHKSEHKKFVGKFISMNVY